MRKKVASCSFKTENVQRRTYNVLPLRELEASACALLSVLLAFLAARVAGDESLGLERLAQLRVELHQRARNTQLHRVGLTHHAAAAHRGNHVEGLADVGDAQRTPCRRPLLRGHKVRVALLLVDRELAAAGAQKHARNRRLAPPRSVVLN